MGLISRVSSRTYRENSQIMFRSRALVSSLMRQSVRSQGSITASPNQKGHHALEPKVIQGDFQVWVGYLRRPPPAQTGYISQLGQSQPSLDLSSFGGGFSLPAIFSMLKIVGESFSQQKFFHRLLPNRLRLMKTHEGSLSKIS